ncbi:hypothetical protein OS121_01705 [Mycolicibacterium mucogenicum]|uniref:glycoside hydrolase family 2 protein n=1 Tax=Mycolicibacterium mucogenicum TaxID=56689 RepID=UPI00226A2ACE|nr:glycoside hydrolase family 2 protein [Mycolicibacterium mucogenicum]MCX8553817.1 hypothetical protein [Mycolicibacterium mucogenicum]
MLSGRDLIRGAGWGLLDSDGNPKAALTVVARTWMPVAVVVSDNGLSGIRIDIHNDSASPRSGELRLVTTNHVGVAIEGTHRVTVPPASSLTLTDADVSGHFRDLSHAFRFGPPAADAVHAEVTLDDGTSIHDVLIVNPRPFQAASAVCAVVMRETADRWILELTSSVALRYVEIDAPGWSLSDNYFHVAATVPYTVILVRHDGGEFPTGTVGSIDLVAPTVLSVRS